MKYSLHMPFDQATEAVCDVLRARGLHIVGQLDLSERFERSLGILISPCRIVFVLPNPDALRTAAIHPWAGAFLPLHVVISDHHHQSEIQIQNAVQPAADATLAVVYRPVMESQGQLMSAIESIASRASFLT